MRTLPIIVTLLFLTGCQQTPSARWVTAQESLTATTEVVHLLAQTGKIKDEDLSRMGEVIMTARAALIEARSQLPEGSQQFGDYLRIVRAAIVRLREIRDTHIEEIEHGPHSDH